jgi:hypothetical protein
MPRASEAGRSDENDPERSLRLRRSTGIPPLPNVKTAYSRRGIVPFDKQPSHREGYVPVAIGRRELIAALGSAAAWPLAARGQQPGQVRRIGILMPYPKSDAESQSYVRAFRQELAGLGWSEGGNVQFDERWSTSNMDLVRADAANLVALNPDVIVIVGDRVIPILTKLTRSIPIVVALTSDPIASGWWKASRGRAAT